MGNNAATNETELQYVNGKKHYSNQIALKVIVISASEFKNAQKVKYYIL